MSLPPRNIPPELYHKYTMNNSISVFDWYIDESIPADKRQTLVWSNDYIQSFVNRFTFENIMNNTFGGEGYRNASLHHVEVCKKYREFIYNKDVAVIGSQTPWIEAILINAGAKSITTVEYNKQECNHSIIKTISYDNFCNSNEVYDSIFSYSSIEHSGLGRYGDALDPEGDIKSINTIYNHLSDSGYLFLGIPVGHDAITWNAHRVYGHKRLDILLKNFNEIEWIALERNYIYSRPPENNGEHPIIVCKKKRCEEIAFNNSDEKTNGELFFYEVIRSNIDIIFDVGCRDDSLFINFDKEVHYFDPVQESINNISKMSTNNKKSFFNAFGLADENKESFFFPAYQSFFDRIRSLGVSDESNKILLQVRMGKNYVIENNVKKIDFLKIDVEGQEFHVLKGFGDFLLNINIVQFEYGGTYLDNNIKLIDIINYLTKYNFYKFSYLTTNGPIIIKDYNDHYNYCNIICINRNSEYQPF